jgi:hypothetical protein
MRETMNYSKFIESDFSDGIRSLICNMFSGMDKNVDATSEEYYRWKGTKQICILPNGDVVECTGRKMMENLGEAVKKVYPDFWAKYCADIVLRQYKDLTEAERYNFIICFGSVRFGCEIEAIEQISQFIGIPVEYIFCNYWNQEAVSEENLHTSERLGNLLIHLGYKHGDIVNIEDIIE